MEALIVSYDEYALFMRAHPLSLESMDVEVWLPRILSAHDHIATAIHIRFMHPVSECLRRISSAIRVQGLPCPTTL